MWSNWAGATETIERLQPLIAEETDADELAKYKEDLAAAEEQLRTASENLAGEVPPDGYLQLREWFTERGVSVLGSPEYMELSEKIYDFHAENVYVIGTVGMVPKPLIAKNTLRNVIDSSYVSRGVLPYGTTDYYYQLFFEE